MTTTFPAGITGYEAQLLPSFALFQLVMLVFKNNRVRGHFELGRHICGFITIERSDAWASTDRTALIPNLSQSLDRVRALALSSLDTVALGFDDGHVLVIKSDTTIYRIEMLGRLNNWLDPRIRTLCFSADGSRLLINDDSRIRMYDVVDDPPTQTFEILVRNWNARRIGFMRDNHTILAINGHNVVAVDTQLTKTRIMHEHPSNINIMASALAPNQTDVCLISETALMSMYALSPSTVAFADMTFTLVLYFKLPDIFDVIEAVYSEDSRRIVVTNHVRSILIIEAKTGVFTHSIVLATFNNSPLRLVCVNTLVAFIGINGLFVIDQAGTETKITTDMLPGDVLRPDFIAWSPSKQALLVSSNVPTPYGSYSTTSFITKKKR